MTPVVVDLVLLGWAAVSAAVVIFELRRGVPEMRLVPRCPRCDQPRELGHRCPDADQQPATSTMGVDR